MWGRLSDEGGQVNLWGSKQDTNEQWVSVRDRGRKWWRTPPPSPSSSSSSSVQLRRNLVVVLEVTSHLIIRNHITERQIWPLVLMILSILITLRTDDRTHVTKIHPTIPCDCELIKTKENLLSTYVAVAAACYMFSSESREQVLTEERILNPIESSIQ